MLKLLRQMDGGIDREEDQNSRAYLGRIHLRAVARSVASTASALCSADSGVIVTRNLLPDWRTIRPLARSLGRSSVRTTRTPGVRKVITG
jgi:hypothetical protein